MPQNNPNPAGGAAPGNHDAKSFYEFRSDIRQKLFNYYRENKSVQNIADIESLSEHLRRQAGHDLAVEASKAKLTDPAFYAELVKNQLGYSQVIDAEAKSAASDLIKITEANKIYEEIKRAQGITPSGDRKQLIDAVSVKIFEDPSLEDVIFKKEAKGIVDQHVSELLTKYQKYDLMPITASLMGKSDIVQDLLAEDGTVNMPLMNEIRDVLSKLYRSAEKTVKDEISGRTKVLNESFKYIQDIQTGIESTTNPDSWASLVKDLVMDLRNLNDIDPLKGTDMYKKLLYKYIETDYDKTFAAAHGSIDDVIQTKDVAKINAVGKILKRLETKNEKKMNDDLLNFTKLYDEAVVMNGNAASKDLYGIQANGNDYFTGGLIYFAELMKLAGTGSEKDPIEAKKRIFDGIKHNEIGVTDLLGSVFGRKKKLKDITLTDVVAAGNYEVAVMVEKWERAPSDIIGAADRIESLDDTYSFEDVMGAYRNGVKYQTWLDRVSKVANVRGTNGEFNVLDRRFKQEMGGGRQYIDMALDFLGKVRATAASMLKAPKSPGAYNIYGNPVIRSGISPSLGSLIALGAGTAIVGDLWEDVKRNYEQPADKRKSFLHICAEHIGKIIPEENVKLLIGGTSSEQMPGAFLAI